jgi:hypothetical protein
MPHGCRVYSPASWADADHQASLPEPIADIRDGERRRCFTGRLGKILSILK